MEDLWKKPKIQSNRVGKPLNFITIMNKLMSMLLGAETHASAKEIRGKKSQGVEDASNYKHWAERKGTNSRDYN